MDRPRRALGATIVGLGLAALLAGSTLASHHLEPESEGADFPQGIPLDRLEVLDPYIVEGFEAGLLADVILGTGGGGRRWNLFGWLNQTIPHDH